MRERLALTLMMAAASYGSARDPVRRRGRRAVLMGLARPGHRRLPLR